MALDIKNFYLKTPLARYKYIRLKMTYLPEDVIEGYKLRDKFANGGYVYMEVQKGMYYLPYSGIITQKLSEYCLNQHRYHRISTPLVSRHNNFSLYTFLWWLMTLDSSMLEKRTMIT